MLDLSDINNPEQSNSYPRVIIESVTPLLIDGAYPSRSTLGEPVVIRCAAFADDHDSVDCQVFIRHESESLFCPFPMEFLGNDEFQARFEPEKLGRYYFYIQGDINAHRAGLLQLQKTRHSQASSVSKNIHEILVEPSKARFSAWYEFFPRSFGTFKECERVLEHVAKMGFDVVYLPPIHPIGLTSRKGKNNTLKAKKGDVGSPWAIGGSEGGHKAIHPDLGSLSDFKNFLAKAASLKIDIALDLAFQCSPDHPYVKEHPEWFKKRLDGSIAYAENPPKKYQDIYPFDFHAREWPFLYRELKSIVTFWIDQGVRIFRVDNPHTKPFHFWKWLLSEIRSEHPDVIFLSEAFTRPHVCYQLAKIGFSQSYTYFTWRHTKDELIALMREYTREPHCYYFRPNLWPNTPDILNADLQKGDKATFIQRLVLAATLSSSYGIYGPAFETLLAKAKEAGSEEYADSEKFELKHHDLNFSQSLAPIIKRINQIRNANTALQHNYQLEFLETNNPKVIAYSKSSPEGSNVILTVVTLDPHAIQEATITLPSREAQLHDLVSGLKTTLNNGVAHLKLNPREMPAAIFRVQKKLRRENDFDYFG